jgi:hypothetical protein
MSPATSSSSSFARPRRHTALLHCPRVRHHRHRIRSCLTADSGICNEAAATLARLAILSPVKYGSRHPPCAGIHHRRLPWPHHHPCQCHARARTRHRSDGTDLRKLLHVLAWFSQRQSLTLGSVGLATAANGLAVATTMEHAAT